MQDERINALAKGLINYSCELKKGEKVLIEAKGIDYMLVTALVREAYKVGAYPFVEIYDNRVSRELLLGESEEYAKLKAKYDGFRMAEMDAYIGIRGGENCNELSDVPEDKEGMQTMRILGKNMAYFIKCIEAGKKAGINLPEPEKKEITNFIR
jgi:aminopeptidase